MKKRFSYVPLLLLFFFLGNCYTLNKKYIYAKPYSKTPPMFTEEHPQFESGKPNKFVDGLGHYVFSLPSKLILWNWKMNNHKISETTKEYLKRYIKENNLTNVKVRFNQYAPRDEWRRLRANKDVHWLAKYTLGVWSWLMYTIFPQRVFAGLIGGDHYNPYTNTIHIFSDIPAVALHEGGHAKDAALRKNKTGYALAYMVPFVALYHEARASEDAYLYVQHHKDREKQQEAYKMLSPAYGTYMGGGLLPNIYGALMVIPGHIYGRSKARKLKKQFAEEDLEKEITPETNPDIRP